MSDNSIYSDIAKRTGGDIYIGVVGPVRTGKSTFIHKFLENVVIPNIEDEYDRQRTLDEMPQSASGKTIMTTEPKFVPDDSVKVVIDDGIEFRVKMVDCVGYLVDGALGAEENGERRMVITPWSEDAMPFTEAAELGTGKVIGEHATIAMLVTTDGSIAGLPRESYIHAEERVARELRQYGKPFAIILNSANPESESAHKLAGELEEKYGAPVALVCCPDLDADDIREILALVLSEFPVREMSFSLPEWTEALPSDHPLKKNIVESVQSFSEGVVKLGDIEKNLSGYDFERVTVNAGDGTAVFNIPIDRSEYYKTLSELCSVNVSSDGDIITTLMELSEIRDKYLRIEDALTDANEKGYGIVMPTVGELKLDEPTLVKQPNGYGVKVSAHADSIHMIKTGIKADLCPVIGSQEQSEEVVKFLQGEFEDNPDKVWEYNMFGRSLYDMVNDGMTAKLSHMPEESREKLGETLGKIINEGSNGLICILL